MPCSQCHKDGHNKITCPDKPETSVSSNSSATPKYATLDEVFHDMLEEDYSLNEGDHITFCGALKKAYETVKLEKSGKNKLHVRTKDADCYIEFLDDKGECDLRIVRKYEKTTSGYITPGNHICEYETRMFIGGRVEEPYQVTVPTSFYIAMKSYIDMMRPKTVRIKAMGLERSFKYEKWIESAMQEDLAEMKAMEAYKKAGGKDKYEDSDCEIWTGEYGYGRFEQFILNRIQQL